MIKLLITGKFIQFTEYSGHRMSEEYTVIMEKQFFHLLNRGVDKRNIFLDKRDYLRFVHNLFEFNDQQNVDSNNFYFQQTLDIGRPEFATLKRHKRTRQLLLNIHFFCLMPNHYHLLVSPLVDDGIPLFMKKLNMGYAKYFNEKYDRNGALFQGKYKKVLIERDAHFLWIPYYIHFNPLDLKIPKWREKEIQNPKKAADYLQSYRWSSHLDYCGEKNFPSVTQRTFFLELFGGEKKYAQSVNEYLKEWDTENIDGVMLE